MAYINGRFRHFTGLHAHLNGSALIQFDQKDLLRSAVRVGKRNTLDLMKHRNYARMEMQYKIAIIRANLMENPSAFMVKSGVYEFLDPSEKSNLSYYFGLSFAHMIAEQFLDIKWLMHLDVHHKAFSVAASTSTKSRPDLFGMNASNDWYVIEAKGRSGAMSMKLLAKAKGQTQLVHSINGINPTRIASVIYFNGPQLGAEWGSRHGSALAVR